MKQYILQLACLGIFFLTQQVQSIYFYLEPGIEKCFKDEVVKNYVSQITYLFIFYVLCIVFHTF